ncbi:MAG TPA: RNA polymerase sigma factor RpoE [Porticoccaceae bacterium]|jgi:RNA polymerase sigma-70 factor (ECF subfamily)|nr:RNA polymerase sigma factor RpoE [Porticoccaceae bacterium]
MVDKNAQVCDQQLVVRVQNGDKGAFDLLVLKYQQKMHAIVSRFVRDTDDVADVVQESFIKAYRALPNFRGDSQFYTWLYRIGVNTAKNYLVARSRRPPSSDVDVADAEYYSGNEYLKDLGTPENNFFRDELESLILKVIAELPEDLRTAVTLREYEGLSYEEIAQIMDCPVGTIRSRIFRARESIDTHIVKLVDND